MAIRHTKDESKYKTGKKNVVEQYHHQNKTSIEIQTRTHYSHIPAPYPPQKTKIRVEYW
jgi:hypothetical protein